MGVHNSNPPLHLGAFLLHLGEDPTIIMPFSRHLRPNHTHPTTTTTTTTGLTGRSWVRASASQAHVDKHTHRGANQASLHGGIIIIILALARIVPSHPSSLQTRQKPCPFISRYVSLWWEASLRVGGWSFLWFLFPRRVISHSPSTLPSPPQSLSLPGTLPRHPSSPVY